MIINLIFKIILYIYFINKKKLHFKFVKHHKIYNKKFKKYYKIINSVIRIHAK